ncbi:MAG: VOC family protein [Thiogranum sp.]|nr:VOC family protein [Thiogranum sp.]
MRIRYDVKIVLLFLLFFGAPALAEQRVRAVDAIGITVSDMTRSLAFYTEVLPFTLVAQAEVSGDAYEHLTGVFGLRMHVVRLKLGDEFIELIQYIAPRGRPVPVDSRSNDRWFQHIAIVVSDMDTAYARLRANHVEHASPAPQRLPDWNPDAGGIEAFYFRDPDGNHLELLRFPEGKGNPKWHTNSDRLFLGIDHTAIVVANTDSSLRFYRNSLGLQIAGSSENYGTEQERLNNVFGARLRITALKASSGPGIELLEYLAPHTGRPMPADTRANDLWHWQIQVTTSDIDMVFDTLRAGRYGLVSSDTIDMPEHATGFVRGLMARDPDGHALLFLQR